MRFWELFAKLYCFFLGKMASWKDGEATVIIVKRMFPKWALAQTWGRIVIFKFGYNRDPGVMKHELVHVTQWKKHGFFFPFKYIYLMIRSALKHGAKKAYYNHPYEIEAREISGH